MDRKESSPLIEALRREQANAVQLYLQYKGYHWNVSGPSFHDLHLLFDAHATQVFEMIDELAERQRILGAPADYTLEALRQASNLVVEEKLPSNPREMVEHLVTSHRRVIDGLKKGIEVADGRGDPGTADLFTRFLQTHEKMEWFLREILEKAAPLSGK
ncbi:MAG: DNA starvation/stationary phase protection protein [Thermoplasmata archaeon]|jgi:starvation-inducible DNA-binding protein